MPWRQAGNQPQAWGWRSSPDRPSAVRLAPGAEERIDFGNEYSLKTSTPEHYYRPDIKVNEILDPFMDDLQEAGDSVTPKIFV
jgi:hypothetical protein